MEMRERKSAAPGAGRAGRSCVQGPGGEREAADIAPGREAAPGERTRGGLNENKNSEPRYAIGRRPMMEMRNVRRKGALAKAVR